MYRILSSLFFFTIFLTNLSFGKSITPPIIDTHLIHLQCSELLNDSRTLRFKTHFFNSLVLINDSVGYYNPVGTLHLFEIHFDSIPKVILLKDCPYNGHNFSRHLFMYNRNLYSLGGGGLFNSNSKLLKYDFKKNEWFAEAIHNLPNYTTKVISSWLNENKLYVCYGLGGEEEGFIFGYVDLDSLNFHLLNHINNLSLQDLYTGFQGLEIYRGEIFSVIEIIGLDCVYRLFNNRSGEFIRVSFLKDRPCINGKSFIYTRDSTIFYRGEDGEVDSTKIDDTNIYYQNSFKELYQSKPEISITLVRILALIVLFISLFGIGFYFIKIKRDNVNENDSVKLISDKLSIQLNRTISRDELDVILGISHLSYESIKSTRSRLVNSINELGKVKITRVRNQKDKRYFDYLIE
jgi:hypothetical protein